MASNMQASGPPQVTAVTCCKYYFAMSSVVYIVLIFLIVLQAASQTYHDGFYCPVTKSWTSNGYAGKLNFRVFVSFCIRLYQN